MSRRVFLVLLALLALLTVSEVRAAGKSFTLVIDAGHGGHDAGALGSFSKEKDINLKVALAFGRLVEQYCKDVTVVYTRKTDVFVPLIDRANIANKRHADIFISIHTNAVAGRRPIRGLETYTMGLRRSDEKLSAAQRENDVILMEKDYQQHYAGYDPNSPESQIMFEFINDQNMEESVRLARLIQRCVCHAANRQDKGVKQDVFLVLRETSMPACLVELGYITTPDEERYLNTKNGQQAIAMGLYQAFRQYKEKSQNVPVPASPQQREQEVAQSATSPTTVPAPSVKEEQPKSVPAGQAAKAAAAEQSASRADATAEQSASRADATAGQTPSEGDRPVFKVQYLASGRKLKASDKAFKGVKYDGCYQEGRLYKYTIGESQNYQEMLRLRRSIAGKFPQAFVVAFLHGQRMDLNEARSYKP